jgi:hypothetical protein
MEYRIQVRQEQENSSWRITAAGRQAGGTATFTAGNRDWRKITGRELVFLNGVGRFWHERQGLETSFCQAAGVPYLPVNFVLGRAVQDGFIEGARLASNYQEEGCWWLPAAAAWLIVAGGQVTLDAAQAWNHALARTQLDGTFSLLYSRGRILPSGEGKRLVYTEPQDQEPSTRRLKRLEHSWAVQRLARL